MGCKGSKDDIVNGSNKSTNKTNKPNTQDSENKKINLQMKIRELEAQITKFQNKQKKNLAKIQTLKKQAYQLNLQNPSSPLIKKYLQQAATLKKQSEECQSRSKALKSQKIILQNEIHNLNTFKPLIQAQAEMNNQQHYINDLDYAIQRNFSLKAQKREIQSKLIQLGQNQSIDQQADKMFQEIKNNAKKSKENDVSERKVKLKEAEKAQYQKQDEISQALRK